VPNDLSDGEKTPSQVRRGLALGCTFADSFELVKQGHLTSAQEGLFAPILVSLPAALPRL
jgi:chromatin segregation and condensation protein Rec8/ScpA/Scc1 (kleisin family)